jgi:hypothetical protein
MTVSGDVRYEASSPSAPQAFPQTGLTSANAVLHYTGTASSTRELETFSVTPQIWRQESTGDVLVHTGAIGDVGESGTVISTDHLTGLSSGDTLIGDIKYDIVSQKWQTTMTSGSNSISLNSSHFNAKPTDIRLYAAFEAYQKALSGQNLQPFMREIIFLRILYSIIF